MVTKKFKDSLIGLTEEEAINKIKEAGFETRIICKNGEFYSVKTDYKFERVNLFINDDKITKVNLG